MTDCHDNNNDDDDDKLNGSHWCVYSTLNSNKTKILIHSNQPTTIAVKVQK